MDYIKVFDYWSLQVYKHDGTKWFATKPADRLVTTQKLMLLVFRDKGVDTTYIDKKQHDQLLLTTQTWSYAQMALSGLLTLKAR
jgi:hypothetical protein